jgi:hypothetical protein
MNSKMLVFGLFVLGMLPRLLFAENPSQGVTQNSQQKWSLEYDYINSSISTPLGGTVGFNFGTNFMVMAGVYDSKPLTGDDFDLYIRGRYNLTVPRDFQKDFFQFFVIGGYDLTVNSQNYFNGAFEIVDTVHYVDLGFGGEFLFHTNFGIGSYIDFYQVIFENGNNPTSFLNSFPDSFGVAGWTFFGRFHF